MATRRYVAADRRMRAYLGYLLREEGADDSVPGQSGLTGGAFRFIDIQMRFSDKESARRLAAEATGVRERRGLRYQATKTGIRIALLFHQGYRLAGDLLQSRGRPKTYLGVTRAKPFFLVSHKVNRHPHITRALDNAGVRQANIVYDLIPVLRPDLVSARFGNEMARFFRRILESPDPIVAISHATRDDLVRRGREVPGVANPVDLGVVQLNAMIGRAGNAERPIPGLAGRRFAVYCATIDRRKSLHLLAAVWRRLAEVLDDAMLPDLVLIGRRGPGWPALRRELEQAGDLAKRIHLLHDVDDNQLRWAYRHALIALYPSQAEGWGLGVSEALAYGVPVVHSDIAVLREVAQGLMPSAGVGDEEAWARLLGDLFSDPGKIDALREEVRTKYKAGEPDDFPRQLIAWLRSLLGVQSASLMGPQLAEPTGGTE